MAAPSSGSGAGTLRLLVLLGALETALLAALAWWPGVPFPLPGLALLGAAFAAYVAAAARLGAPSGEPGGGPGRRPHPAGTAVVWGVAVALRLVLLPAAPELSDDFWRYLWDGRVQLAGVNPYLHAPSAAEVAPLRPPWHGAINNPDVPTIYPPGAQLAFLLLAAVGGGVLPLKLLWTACDLAAGAVLGRVAAATGRCRRRVLLLWLWSPLLVVETAWNAHLEALGLLGVALALAFAAGVRRRGPPGVAPPRPKPALAGAALAWAAMVKVAPAAAVPVLARRLGPRAVAAFGLACAALTLPYLGAGAALGEGLATYARHWRFMEGPFALLEAALPGPTAPRLAAAALVVAVVAVATVRAWSLERSLLWILGAGLLLTPTLHPWYALWILPVAALRGSAPWILLTGLAPLGYLGLGAYHDTGTWPQPAWARLLLWTPVLALLVREGVRAWRGARVGDGPQSEAQPA